MFKRAFTFGSILLLLGCADPIDSAKKSLEAGSLNGLDVEYRNMRSFPGDVVCGEVNARDRWGEGEGYRRFIVRADRSYAISSEDDWEIFCSENPAAALQAQSGIDLMSGKNSTLQTVQRHLTELDFALRQYLADNGVFPQSTQELLSARITSPESKSLTEGGHKEGGYIDKIPEDPWGRPYHYEKLRQLHPAPKACKLYTLGRDGVAGGTGEDADIGNWQLKYLDHIANL